jgi:hypothetical protein
LAGRVKLTYPLENLGPERFQHFCQALVTREFPRVQCFPVAQPDGGRDAVSFYHKDQSDSFIAFQVKFSRNPSDETDPHKWLLAIMDGELDKVKSLIGMGASQYVLLTNIPGTGHPQSGSIDKMNRLMAEKLGLPSQCWWRNDIERRLDNAWSLKWAYPELMTGPDFLRWITETGFAEHRERRDSAIRAFLRTQYQMDEDVRFKQVELQNKLLDLFIDVPISFRGPVQTPQQLHDFFSRWRSKEDGNLEDEGEEWSDLESDVRGYRSSDGRFIVQGKFEAASLLLSDAAQYGLPRVVVEGAPGQGKSTIAQYVCQVHRMRLLQEVEMLTCLPAEHREAPVRLPIKVDLRDLATWMGKKDPFNVQDQNSPPHSWRKSLEAFLAALISHHSGGMEFTPDDLIAVMRISCALLVFDGLDEVADIARRKDVVEEIERGVARIEENAASLQVIITSRPAAFANSPGMSHANYLYLQLVTLNRHLIMQYAERWLTARKLSNREGREFRNILKEKLDQPHLRDLARNPMQLAILLSLLLTRGPSLPDKRTALYDDYMDLFFNREAEKSQIVREHRELLINIHRYLAWLLHSEAESGNSRASITQSRLQHVLKDYLCHEGHDTRLVDELFTGMVERVVALVSRVEGTFEFEVQPLREYFAACHLYYTAPQSSPGKEKPGSKPDRFDAIARNFYWLNVTRFYAGCYSKGELPSLVERLQELLIEDGFRLTGYPRTLAATLLADWVFNQNPRSVQQILDLVLDGVGFRYLMEQRSPRLHRPGITDGPVLPPKCGREELLQRGFSILQNNPPRDFEDDVIAVMRAHIDDPSEIGGTWMMMYKNNHTLADRQHWLSVGLNLGVISVLPLEQLKQLLAGSFSPSNIAALMLDARRVDYLESSEEMFEEAVAQILDQGKPQTSIKKCESALDSLRLALDPHRYAIAFRNRAPVALEVIISDYYRSAVKLVQDPQLTSSAESYKSHSACIEVARVAEVECKRTGHAWATLIAPWDSVTERARTVWGDSWALIVLAAVASGIRSTSEKCQDAEDLLDRSRSLCRRARYARLRSGVASWWKKQFQQASSGDELLLISLLCANWTTTNTLLAVMDEFGDALDRLRPWEWTKLSGAARRLRFLTAVDESRCPIDATLLPADLSDRLVVLTALRADEKSRHDIFKRYLESSPSDDPEVLDLIAREATDPSGFGTPSWNPNLSLIEMCYERGRRFWYVSMNFEQHQQREIIIPSGISSKIMQSPEKFPGEFVRLAEGYCRREVAKGIIPVAQVAERDKWFA